MPQQPLVAITLSGEGQPDLGTVLVGERKGADGKTEYTAMKAGGTTVFTARDYLVTRLNKKADAFIEKAVTPGAPAAGAIPQVVVPVGTPGGVVGGDDEPMDAEGEE